MNDKAFLDSNIVLYAFKLDDPRNKTAARLLGAGAILGVQTLNEFVNVARRRLAMPWDRVFIVAAAIQAECGTLYSEDMQHGQRIDVLRFAIRSGHKSVLRSPP